MKSIELYQDKLLKMDLQFFAEGDGEGSGAGEEGQSSDPQPIVFKTQAELDSWKDKELGKSLKTAKEKWEADKQKDIENAKSEAERLAQMTEEQKAEAQRQKEADALAAREADITRRELRAQSLEQLAERELPKELIEVVVLTDADACKASIDAIETAFRVAVEAGINKRLASSANPPSGSNSSGGNERGSEGSRLAKQATNNSKVKDPYFDKN